eukprot:jgi/Ulvmu1/8464/UM043_0044.1
MATDHHCLVSIAVSWFVVLTSAVALYMLFSGACSSADINTTNAMTGSICSGYRTFVRPYVRLVHSGVDAGRRLVSCNGRGRGLQELLSLENEDAAVPRTKLKKLPIPPAQPVPDHIPKPIWYNGKQPPNKPPVEVHGADGIKKMRASGALAAQVLTMAGNMVAPGVTTEEIDRAVHEMTVAAGAYPSPLRYGQPPFPKSVCTSVNECICHGIPDGRPLQEGDIVNIDVTVWLDGYHGDTSRTFMVGEVAPGVKKLVEATNAALHAGIDVCGPGVDCSEIGNAIQRYSDSSPYTVSNSFIGHGVGKNFHAAPWVFHVANREREGTMQVGQTFTIEPILHMGKQNHRVWRDGWTAVTRDGSLSAQFEHTLLITESGVEILTAYE